MRKLVSTKDMPREQWLEYRRKSIGGSEAAIIAGLNQYSSLYALWADKMGLLPEKEDSEQMRQGRDFENYVAQQTAKFITGARPLDEFDAYLQELDGMGFQQYLQYYVDAYAVYTANGTAK